MRDALKTEKNMKIIENYIIGNHGNYCKKEVLKAL